MKNSNEEDGGLKYHHSDIDPKANKSTSPPLDEIIRIPSVWVFEVFPPTFISNLRLAAEKLNWTRDDRVINPDFPDSVDQMRFRLAGGGWLNLGYIVRDSGRAWDMNRKAELPDGIEAIHASILQYSPSTTILVCQFFLDDSAAKSLEQPLREYYSTFKEEISGGWRYDNVESQKRLAVDIMRESLQTLCTEWVKVFIPGLFASGIFGESFPICEFITLEKHEPYESLGEKTETSFLSMIDLDNEFYAWKSEEISGLYLQLSEEKDRDLYRLILAGKISEVLKDKNLDGYPFGSREGKILSWMSHLDNTFGIWVLYVIARTYEKQLGILRDSYGSIDLSASLVLAASKVNSLDKKFLDLQRNLIPFLQEIVPLCKKKQMFMHNVYKFIPVSEHRKHDSELFNTLRERLLANAASLLNNEQQVSAVAQRSAQIVSAISNDKLAKTNIRLQKGILRMTCVLIILTLILVVSELNDRGFLNNMIDQLSRLFHELTKP
jgi:hypothetical protein